MAIGAVLRPGAGYSAEIGVISGRHSQGVAPTQAPWPATVADEIFQVLAQETPAAGKVAGREPACGDPALDGAYDCAKDLGDVLVGVHRLEGHAAARKERLKERVLLWCCVVQYVLLLGPPTRTLSGACSRTRRRADDQFGNG